MFPDVRAACRAAAVLRNETSVDAVEMFDRAALRECEKEEKMLELVPDVKGGSKVVSNMIFRIFFIECLQGG